MNIRRSGFSYPNEFSRITIAALEDIIGSDGVDEVLSKAQLTHLPDRWAIPDLQPGLDFAEFSQINKALEDIYGPRGYRGVAVRLGEYIFLRNSERFRLFTGIGCSLDKQQGEAYVRRELRLLANFFSQMTDQITSIRETPEFWIYSVHRCPVCWGRNGAKHPVCYPTIGFLKAGIKKMTDGVDHRIEEYQCAGMGDDHCEFRIEKTTTD